MGEYDLKKQNENTRKQITNLESQIMNEKELIRRKMLKDQLVKWKEFVKRQEWMHKKFKNSILEEQERENFKLKMIQKDEEVRNNVQRELERRVLWSRKMDVRRKERSLITKQLKKEQAAKQEEYRQKSAQREKEILKMKKFKMHPERLRAN